MGPSQPIHDLFIKRLHIDQEEDHERMVLLRFEDHLLRRFGALEFLSMEQHSTTPLRLRVVADEAWALVEGKVEFVWWDLRVGSPTKNGTHRLLASEPTLVMTPFGVAFGVRVLETSSLLVRATTHDEGEHAGDRILRWEDLP